MNDKMIYRKRGSLWIINYVNANRKAEITADEHDNKYVLELSITNVTPETKVLISMILQIVYRISKTKIKNIELSFPLTCTELESELQDYGFNIVNRTSYFIYMDKRLGGHNEMLSVSKNFPAFDMEPKFHENKIVIHKLSAAIQDKSFFTPPTFTEKGEVKIFFTNQFNFKKILPIPTNELKSGDIVCILRSTKWNGLYNDEITTICTITKVYAKGRDYNTFTAFNKLFNNSMQLKRSFLEDYYNNYNKIYEVIINERFTKGNRINKYFLMRKDLIKLGKNPLYEGITPSQLRYIIEFNN